MLGGSMNGGHLTPSQMKIKGIQIKLHLPVSSLNFLIPSHFICFGLIETSKKHIQISYCFLIGEKYKFRLYNKTNLLFSWRLHRHLHNKLFLYVFKSFYKFPAALLYLPYLHLVFWLYLLLLLCNCVAWNFLATANLKINHISIFLKCQC